MENLVELAIPLLVLIYLAIRCVRFRPHFHFVNPFAANSNLLYDRKRKGNVTTLLGILALLMAIPIGLTLFIASSSEDGIQFGSPRTIVKENHFSDIDTWLPDELKSDFGALRKDSVGNYRITFDHTYRNGSAVFSSLSEGQNAYYVVKFRTTKAFDQIETYQIFLRKENENTTLWEGSIIHRSEN